MTGIDKQLTVSLSLSSLGTMALWSEAMNLFLLLPCFRMASKLTLPSAPTVVARVLLPFFWSALPISSGYCATCISGKAPARGKEEAL